MVAFERITLLLRIPQVVFVILVLGLTGHWTEEYSNMTENYIDEYNFLLFCPIWSVFVLIYLAGVAPFVKGASHPIALVVLDGVTAIFWFAGFIAAAAAIAQTTGYVERSFETYLSGPWAALKAATAFGAFTWVLFMATFALNLFALVKGRRGDTKTVVSDEDATPVTGTGVPMQQQYPPPQQSYTQHQPEQQAYPPQAEQTPHQGSGAPSAAQGYSDLPQVAAPYPSEGQGGAIAMPSSQPQYR